MIFFLLVLSSCSATTNTNQQLLTTVAGELKKKHNVDHGDLVATYDLARIKKTNYIYAQDFGLIINEKNYNNIFLQKFKARYKKPADLEQEAEVKIARIKGLMLKLNSKYHLFSRSELHFLNHSLPNNDIFASETVAVKKLARLDRIIRTLPIMLPQYRTKLTSHYGRRSKHPVNGKKAFHCGSDFLGPKGTPIYSSADGVISMVGRIKGYGNIIEIKHGGKFKTRYAHLRIIHVKEGEKVIRGQKIGTQGNTGNSTAEHLHFEIWLNEKHVDPFDFLAHACKC